MPQIESEGFITPPLPFFTQSENFLIFGNIYYKKFLELRIFKYKVIRESMF